nr:MAG TPA: Mor transcription activator family [Caudoviricetes sp.]
MDVLSQAKYEDMTEEQKMLIDTIGADCFMDLVRVYGGSYVYIPKNDNIVRFIRNRNIRNDFNGHNFKELAAKYGLTVARIRSIIKETKSTGKG